MIPSNSIRAHDLTSPRPFDRLSMQSIRRFFADFGYQDDGRARGTGRTSSFFLHGRVFDANCGESLISKICTSCNREGGAWHGNADEQLTLRFRPQVNFSPTEQRSKFSVTPPVRKNSFWCVANRESWI